MLAICGHDKLDIIQAANRYRNGYSLVSDTVETRRVPMRYLREKEQTIKRVRLSRAAGNDDTPSVCVCAITSPFSGHAIHWDGS